jgi:hypothetical protein
MTSNRDYFERKELALKHLFDGSDLNVYANNIMNLSAGTPSESLLEKCNDLFKTATDHLLVRLIDRKKMRFIDNVVKENNLI